MIGSIRWLLAKDLRILWRSPITTAVLVVYPVLVALLIDGFCTEELNPFGPVQL